MEIDICIATKNSAKTLPKLLNKITVDNQNQNHRILIADGDSDDNTIELVEKNTTCKIISYEDKSPEEALNKLLQFEPQNLKIIVGSDDWLSNEYIDVFEKEANKLIQKGVEKFILLPKFYKNIGSKYIGFNLPLPIFFLHLIGIGRGIGWGIYNSSGALPLLNEDIYIATDYEFLLRCKINKYLIKYVPCTYYHLKNGRSSKDWLIGVQEEKGIAQYYCKNIILKIMINLIFILKFSYKKLLFIKIRKNK
tara:strand:- start:384 stop:1136 length:753 start_codon:yes stop_codon:yes gene_type:complete